MLSGVLCLTALPVLTFLDVRGTGIRRAALAPLERAHPKLHLIQGSVLSAGSMSLAAAVLNCGLFACACGPGQGVQNADLGIARTRAGHQSPGLQEAGGEGYEEGQPQSNSSGSQLLQQTDEAHVRMPARSCSGPQLQAWMLQGLAQLLEVGQAAHDAATECQKLQECQQQMPVFWGFAPLQYVSPAVPWPYR